MSPHATGMKPDEDQETSSQNRSFASSDESKRRASEKPPGGCRSFLSKTPSSELHDLICVGFGPASLAIAVALHDAIEFEDRQIPALSRSSPPKVCFLEKQDHFAWHAGMQLEDAKMQISWIKDLATLRNPRSAFTFLNYLHANERLVPFTNLGTFLPLRVEYEAYMQWCAAHFNDVVQYQQEGIEVIPVQLRNVEDAEVDAFEIKSRNLKTGQIETRVTRHVVLSLGGRPKIPEHFPQNNLRVIHTSGFNWEVPQILPDREEAYKVVIVGAGQSAAETFNDLHSRFPNSHTRLIIRNGALKPSDDSPFVNEIFNPDRIDSTFSASVDRRAADLAIYRTTNYGVVRLELLEHMHAQLYKQRLHYSKEEDWPHRVLAHREVVAINETIKKQADSKSSVPPLEVHLVHHKPTTLGPKINKETLEADLVVVASGYERNAHEQLLRPAQYLRPDRHSSPKSNVRWTVGRDYRVEFAEHAVASDAGVWLQGCNEETHGLSDTLLSVLATRSAEVVQSIFGPGMQTPSRRPYGNTLERSTVNGMNGDRGD